jgi:hypothetical protein
MGQKMTAGKMSAFLDLSVLSRYFRSKLDLVFPLFWGGVGVSIDFARKSGNTHCSLQPSTVEYAEGKSALQQTSSPSWKSRQDKAAWCLW